VFLFMVFSALAAAQVSLVELLRERQAALLDARAALEAAVSSTHLALGARLAPLAADAALARHLDWQLANSVKGALESRLAAGEADRFAIVGEGCKELFRAGKGPALDCAQAQKAANAGLGAAFATGDAEGAARLGLAMRVTSGLLVGDVALDDVWLSRHARLKQTLERAGLSLERTQAPLAPSAIVVGAAGGARLVTRQPLDRFFRLEGRSQGFAGGTPQFVNPLLWPTLGAAACFAAVALVRGGRRRMRLVQLIRDHAEGVLDKDAAAPHASSRPSPDRALAIVRDHIKELADAALGERRELRAQLAAAEARTRTLEDELTDLQGRLGAQAGFESLATQLRAATRPFLERLARLRDVAENLQDVTGSGLTQSASTLASRLAAWRQGLEERGSRKFIRGLAESPSATDATKTLLDDELAAFAALGAALADQAVHAKLGSQAVVRETQEVAKLAAHWEALAAGAATSERLVTLAESLTEARALAAASGIDVAGLELSEASCVWPSVPARAAVSALYHLLAALAAWQTRGVQIACRTRKEPGRTMAIFSLHGETKTPAAGASEAQAKHLETAKTLLAPHGITLGILPTRSGASPIALRWDDTRTAAVVPPSLLKPEPSLST
jgi:hypothetical protein